MDGGLTACSVYPGNVLMLGQVFTALHRLIEANGYRIVDAPRQIYLRDGEPGQPDLAVSEMQFPIAKQVMQ